MQGNEAYGNKSRVVLEIVPCETLREADGLALSSRNRFLSAKERKLALAVPRALDHAREEIANGERDAMEILEGMAEILSSNSAVEIDYCALVDSLPRDGIWRPLGEGGCPLVKEG